MTWAIGEAGGSAVLGSRGKKPSPMKVPFRAHQGILFVLTSTIDGNKEIPIILVYQLVATKAYLGIESRYFMCSNLVFSFQDRRYSTSRAYGDSNETTFRFPIESVYLAYRYGTCTPTPQLYVWAYSAGARCKCTRSSAITTLINWTIPLLVMAVVIAAQNQCELTVIIPNAFLQALSIKQAMKKALGIDYYFICFT